MMIECEGCKATYNIPDSKIPEDGTRVRCKKCQNIISVHRESAEPETDAAPAPDTKSEVINKAKGTASTLSEKALHFGKKAKEKANNFREFTNNKPAADKNGLLPGGNNDTKFNRFLAFSFKIGKYISAFCIVVFFQIFMGATIFYFTNFGTSFEKPKFDPGLFQGEKSDDFQDYDIAGKQERIEIENKYEKQVKFIVQKLYKKEYWAQKYDAYFNKLARIPEDYRGAYINGFVVFLEDGIEFYQTHDVKGEAPTFDEIISTYNNRFQRAMNRAESEEKSAEQKRLMILGVIGASMLLYIIFLMIPILIKIEENTRNKKSANTPEMELANMRNENGVSAVNRQSSVTEKPGSHVA